MTPSVTLAELQAHSRKCRALASHLVTRLADLMEAADQDTWNAAAKEAGLNPPSETSRTRVLEMLRGIR